MALPSELKLAAVSDRHVYLSAYDMAMEQGRLRRDLAVNLVEKARALLAGSPVDNGDMEVSGGCPSAAAAVASDASSVLFEALGERLRQVETSLQQLLNEADAAVQGLVEELQKWHR